ncbi:hypothetical protein ALI22I_20605 [Saccharothrix sp. ALI-22-I]|uniref:hypothetical protein n=1 Tax=Saccharothrix sp. ALI-22-I TaxID=1933778 RepID=UPI00097C34F7|nr:hypothetical protein [Saccharothrix sp. ALI-22-I]ONI88141.1 hypothetical protein ALI22I_20605 [Saccharothrix sp. ALI-22-I]
MITPLRAALITGAALLALSSCTGGGAFSPGPTASSTAAADAVDPAVPEEHRATAAAYAQFRSVDACGLLYDGPAVATVFGDKDAGDELLPDKDGLGNCTLRIDTGDFASSYNLYLEPGAEFDQARRNEAKQETLDGVAVFVEQPAEDGDRNCTVAADVDQQLGMSDEARGLFAVELRVQSGASRDTAPSKPACDVARQWVTATAAQWKQLPRRDGDRSTPRLELAGQDPCKAVAAVVETAPGAQLRPTAPSTCEVRLPAGVTKEKTRAQAVKVVFGVDQDPTVAPGQRTTTATISGKKAAVTERGIDCTVQLPWQPGVTIVADNASQDAPGLVQLVTIHTPACDTAQATAETILAKVAAPSTDKPEQRKDAPVRLGDLDTPPDAASVSAPFDPCDINTAQDTDTQWAAFPAEVRHPGDTAPRLLTPGPQDKFAVACRYTNNEQAQATTDGQTGTGQLGKVFLTTVFWAQPGAVSLDTVNRTNARDADFAGKKGLIRSYKDRSDVPSCATIFTLANGIAGVTVTQNRFAADPCAIATQVSTAIASGTP